MISMDNKIIIICDKIIITVLKHWLLQYNN